LNDFFCSVFTKEDTSNVPTPDLCNKIRSTDRLEDIIIKPKTTAVKLEKLKSDGATENARPENAGLENDGQLRKESQGLENAGLENDGPC